MENNNSPEFRTIRGYELEKREESRLTYAMEDYLEMIGRLIREDGYTRVGVLSLRLNVKPSSASKMCSKLTELGYVVADRAGGIHLTESGSNLADYLIYRHETIENFLRLLGLDSTLEEAEQLEHYMSEDTIKRLDQLNDFFTHRPDFERQFRRFMEDQG